MDFCLHINVTRRARAYCARVARCRERVRAQSRLSAAAAATALADKVYGCGNHAMSLVWHRPAFDVFMVKQRDLGAAWTL
jgi:hypothetical protein